MGKLRKTLIGGLTRVSLLGAVGIGSLESDFSPAKISRYFKASCDAQSLIFDVYGDAKLFYIKKTFQERNSFHEWYMREAASVIGCYIEEAIRLEKYEEKLKKEIEKRKRRIPGIDV